ncbi:hypothetical protein QN362_13525 [Actimicrobium sp. CCC2.4]|uniref:hypothetical protein n=1 Tax=Actimicrobium sp. CCC2.4 TaxID=3048606 RepID=UPI002AC8B7A3|nr:hypothetical protein [Actimicrobium sp. CCC2.4]MEB0136357.1 hypothetical protein [Actimicrobium sp. CCC2.4]WPX31176.1 hypothetical protein RHM62_13080 [Actimicrobium sp. CCC2.4]
MYPTPLLVATLTAVLLSACATPAHHVPAAPSHRTVQGTVVSFYFAGTPAQELPPCLAMRSPAERAEHRYVRISYPSLRQTQSTVAEWPDAVQLVLNQPVDVWPENCAAGRLGRLARVLPLQQ